jgi:hypothetical protein
MLACRDGSATGKHVAPGLGAREGGAGMSQEPGALDYFRAICSRPAPTSDTKFTKKNKKKNKEKLQ